MNQLKKFGKILIVVFLVSGLYSCDEESGTLNFKIIGDVLVLKKKVNDATVYAQAYFAYGTEPMTSAEVVTPGGNSIALLPLDQLQLTWAKEATANDFSTNLPQVGSFKFSVVNEGITHEASDLLVFDNIDFPVIDSTSYSTFNQTMTVEWQAVEGANHYMVKLAKPDGTIIYFSNLLFNNVLSFEIDTNLGSWTEYPVDGGTYSLEVHAIKYESEANQTEYAYQVQEVSIAEKDIVWGE